MRALKKSQYKNYVTMITIDKLERIIFILSSVHWAECNEFEFDSLIENSNIFVHNAPFELLYS